MFKRTTTAILALTLATTGMTARPAKAMSGEEMALWLLGTVAVVAVVNELDKDKPKKSSSTSSAATTQTVTYDDHGHSHGNGHGHDHNHNHHSSTDQRNIVLPAQCLRETDRPKNERYVVSETCLKKNGFQGTMMPRKCYVHYDDNKGNRRDGYSSACLMNKGYSFGKVAAK